MPVCTRVRPILVLVWGRQTVYGQNTVYLLPVKIHSFWKHIRSTIITLSNVGVTTLCSFFSLRRMGKNKAWAPTLPRMYQIHIVTRVGHVLCTTYVQPGMSSYVPGMSRLPRYVYVDTNEPGLHPPPKKEQKAYWWNCSKKNKYKSWTEIQF